jgi:hypothetical protein
MATIGTTEMKTNQSTTALCRDAATNNGPLTAKSRGRGWDCVRQMQMFRQRPDVLASALHDMGFSESGNEIPDSDEQPSNN